MDRRCLTAGTCWLARSLPKANRAALPSTPEANGKDEKEPTGGLFVFACMVCTSWSIIRLRPANPCALPNNETSFSSPDLSVSATFFAVPANKAGPVAVELRNGKQGMIEAEPVICLTEQTAPPQVREPGRCSGWARPLN